MKTFLRLIPLPCALMVALAALPTRARADDRLAGYWVSAPDDAQTAAFSFSILGKWTIMSAHWEGYSPDLKIRYTVVTSGAEGTFTADEKTDRFPDAPRAFTYELKGSELFLTIRDTAHMGKYHLVKGVAPSSVPPPAQVPPPSHVSRQPAQQPGQQRRPSPLPPGAHDPNAVLGNWVAEPGASQQISLSIAIAGPTSVKIAQLWGRGDGDPATSRGEYSVVFAAGGTRGTLTKAKPDFDGSPIPLRMDYALVDDALVVTVQDGPFVGQYRLVRKTN